MSDNEYYSGGDSGSDSDSDSEPIHTKGKVDILKKMVSGITIDNDEDNDDDDEIEDEPDEIGNDLQKGGIGDGDDDDELSSASQEEDEEEVSEEEEEGKEEEEGEEEDLEEGVGEAKTNKTPVKNKSKKPVQIELPSDDEDEDYDDSYLQKFDSEVTKNYINDFHPECFIQNYDEVSKLTNVVRDSFNIIIDPLHRTIPFLTKYEKARVLGQRAKQIEMGAKPFISVPENVIDGYVIAELELQQKRIPFIIRRPIPGGAFEYWNIRDLEVISF
jgi:DNA-directed RNA polymerase I, II, and III subunit RPABC2